MKKQKIAELEVCANCKFLGNEITRDGIKPICKKGKKKFKERVILNYYDKEFLEKKCEMFKRYKEGFNERLKQ